MSKIKEYLNSPFIAKNKLRLIVLAGISGILLILASGLFEDGARTRAKDDFPDDAGSYQKQLEKRLTELVSSISGAGRAEVMITLEGTEEYIFAEEGKSSRSSGDGKSSDSTEHSIFTDGSKEALLKKIEHPVVKGAAVVCEGGDNPKVCEAVYKSVSTVLGIPTSRVYVTKLQ